MNGNSLPARPRQHRGLAGSAFPFNYPRVRPDAVDYANTCCPNAASVEKRCFFVPVHPTYEPRHIEIIGRAIQKVLAGYARA